MPTHIEMTRSQYEAMILQLRTAYPLEACGLMAGLNDRVIRLYPVSNIKQSPVAYEMDPAEQLAAIIDLEERGWELLAIYHSHPQGPQVPSATDIDQAYYPETAYIIVSFSDPGRPSTRAFTINSGAVAEIPIHLL
jgi:proteasome lid subunit RPN8/RPN11